MKKIIITLILSCLFPFLGMAQNPISDIRDEVHKNIAISIHPPDESIYKDSFYCYNELLRIYIDGKSKIRSIEVSDGSSGWFSKEITRLKEKGRIGKTQIEQICLKKNIKNTSIVIPIVVASFGYTNGCYKDKSTPASFFKFNGINLSGNIFFADPIEHIDSVHWKEKAKNQNE